MPELPHESNSEAVSEIIGHILIFGILSSVLILSLLAFNLAQGDAVEQVSEVRADSIAKRLSGVIVEHALLAESINADEFTYSLPMDLPQDLEGRSYRINLDANQVTVTIGKTIASATLFSAGVPADVIVCDMASSRSGGPLQVTLTTEATPDCPNRAGSARAIILEDIP